jgi:hypothetical protein
MVSSADVLHLGHAAQRRRLLKAFHKQSSNTPIHNAVAETLDEDGQFWYFCPSG